MNLTKSDFKLARTCPTKLYYKKLGFPSLKDDSSYLKFLADGGYMVEKMAKLLYPGGKELYNRQDPIASFADTKGAISAGDGVFFEATVLSGIFLARIDILCVEGKRLRLIEVKASSVNSVADGPSPFRTKGDRIVAGWRPYLEDATFQAIVLERAFPDYVISPFLCLIDKAKVATANSTFDKFQMRRGEGNQLHFDYTGNARELLSENVLATIDVSREVEELHEEVEQAMREFASSIQGDVITRIEPEVGKKCKMCEYRLPSSVAGNNGFRACWGELGEVTPHVLDIYRLDLLGGKKQDPVAELAQKGLARQSDLPPELIRGEIGERQRLQLDYTAADKEFIAAALPRLLLGHRYPLHFIDFEGSRLAIPYHKGMCPYEQASFQWSCHTLRETGVVKHSEWLNDQDAFPNFEFARALRKQIGNEGTVYIWSNYEIAILREIRQQMTKYKLDEPELAEWIDTLTANGDGRIVDLCALAKDYYFHPEMRGSLSIKDVFPAVWKADATLRSCPPFKDYVKFNRNGNLLDPYSSLPPLPIGSEEEVVKEGTGAMRVYQEMMFGASRQDTAVRESYRKLLLQYCKLDTAAMIAIWMHWKNAPAAESTAQISVQEVAAGSGAEKAATVEQKKRNARPGKRLVLFFDGTWNEPGDHTNVRRLMLMLADHGKDGVSQKAFYDEGVGTRWYDRLSGGAFGAGLSANVRSGYRWLVENYSKRDEIYIFGFSRGAFTARSLAGLIARCGLLKPQARISFAQLYERYQKGDAVRPIYEIHRDRANRAKFDFEETALLYHSYYWPGIIKMVGVWDTVGSIGVPVGNFQGISRRTLWFHNTRLSTTIEHSYQALALDEYRKPYWAVLWTDFVPESSDPTKKKYDHRFVEQRWFTGAHANVGGGYRSDLLPDRPLEWLQEKAIACGLTFRATVKTRERYFKATVRDSYSDFLKGSWKYFTLGQRYARWVMADPVYKKSRKTGARQSICGWVQTANERIDVTVIQRCKRDPKYRPRSLVEWAERRKLNLEDIILHPENYSRYCDAVTTPGIENTLPPKDDADDKARPGRLKRMIGWLKSKFGKRGDV